MLVQSEASAQYDDIPRSALATGVADFVLPPSDMPSALLQYIQHPVGRAGDDEPLVTIATEESRLAEVFVLLRSKFGIDFLQYKPTTIGRRIERRITIMQADSLASYIGLLKSDPDELNTLYKDLLIGVTEFFRDPDAFELLEKTVVAELVDAATESGLQIWVPGCATGEKAYSLAIMFQECARARNRDIDIKVFATDVHRASLEKAGARLYAAGSVTDVRPDRLNRYFTKSGDEYRVSSDLRQMVIFAPHNVVNHRPFTKMDLVSCRNMLNYLKANAQQKAISLFHFALKSQGL